MLASRADSQIAGGCRTKSCAFQKPEVFPAVIAAGITEMKRLPAGKLLNASVVVFEFALHARGFGRRAMPVRMSFECNATRLSKLLDLGSVHQMEQPRL